MAAIDLRTVNFRAKEEGDESEPPSLTPIAGAGTNKISLAAVKFRAKSEGDDED